MKRLLCFVFILLVGWGQQVSALSLIRDDETETLLRDYADPVLRAAQLDPGSVRIFIVNDPAINAFVAGGANLFIHTGLILASDDPTMLIGVIAHEAGHIAGGHLARGTEALENAQLSAILSFVLGAAAGIAGGGEAAAGVMSAGQHLATRNLLSFTRINEQSADQAALQYLEQIGVSPAGLLDLMERLRSREKLYRQNIDPYALTHPLSKERIAHIRGHLLQHPEEKKSLLSMAEINKRHKAVLAKLKGFLQPAEQLLQQPQSSDSNAQLTRAIALHRNSQPTEALEIIDTLIEKAPQNPYLHELKGQFFAESSRYEEALHAYGKAQQLRPRSALLQSAYGQTLLALSKPEEALPYLRQSSIQDPTYAANWHYLGQALAALNKDGEASLAYAEAALLKNAPELARRYATEALEKLDADSPSRLRAQDAREEAIRLQKESRDEGSPF